MTPYSKPASEAFVLDVADAVAIVKANARKATAAEFYASQEWADHKARVAELAAQRPIAPRPSYLPRYTGRV